MVAEIKAQGLVLHLWTVTVHFLQCSLTSGLMWPPSNTLIARIMWVAFVSWLRWGHLTAPAAGTYLSRNLALSQNSCWSSHSFTICIAQSWKQTNCGQRVSSLGHDVWCRQNYLLSWSEPHGAAKNDKEATMWLLRTSSSKVERRRHLVGFQLLSHLQLTTSALSLVSRQCSIIRSL